MADIATAAQDTVKLAADAWQPDVGMVESILDAISFGIVVLDGDERVVLWSGWLEKVCGIASAAARGRQLVDIFPELAGGRVLGAVHSALRQGFPAVLSQSLNKAPFPLFGKVSPKGEKERIQQKINILPLPRADGTRYCLIEIFDVSLAVLREKVLGEQKKFLNTIVESAPECVMVLAADGSLVQINKSGLAMLEVASGEEARAAGFASFILPAQREGFAALARQVFAGVGGTLEFEIEGKARTRRWLEMNATPLSDAQGKVTALLAVSRDTTERLQQAAVDRLFHEIDQQILHGQSKQGLFEFICAEVARIFGYPFVWIGRKVAGGSVAISARGGSLEGAYFSDLDRLGVRWDSSALGQGPAGSAIRSGQTQVADTSDPGFAPWRAAAERHGLRAHLSIPLILRGEVFGSFTLSSRFEQNFRSAATVQRLSDIASRICVAQERAMDHEQLRLLQTALSTAANGVFITDKLGRIQWLNAAFVKMTGYSEEDALGATPRLLRLGSSDDGFFQEMLESIGNGEAWSGESVEKHKDGTAFNVRQTITPIRDGNGETTHFISILEDITATRSAEASIQRMAHYDYLTGLPNRALFADRLKHELARAKRSRDLLALMFLDLDYFKSVNDTHGHDVGDLLLKEVATRLTACVRESDTVARLAGDEFTIIVTGMTSRPDVALVAQKVIDAIAAPFVLGNLSLKGGVSVGISLFPEDGADDAGLLKCADIAMYAAKRGGRNDFRFFTDQNGQATLDLGSGMDS